MKYLSLILFVAGCTVTPAPVPPPDGPATCEDACANIATFGGCKIDPASCYRDCHAEDAAEAEIGVRFPRGCLAAAHDCQEALRCE